MLEQPLRFPPKPGGSRLLGAAGVREACQVSRQRIETIWKLAVLVRTAWRSVANRYERERRQKGHRGIRHGSLGRRSATPYRHAAKSTLFDHHDNRRPN